MVIERQITVYDCSFCQKTYSQKEDAERCETSCAKLSGSPDISILNLTPRTFNCLKIAGIDTVKEVFEKTDSELLKLKGFGEWCLRDLHKHLQLFENETEGIEEPEELLRNAQPQRFYSSDGKLDLPELLKDQITQFVDHQDWVRLYKDYRWRDDTWKQGFPAILRLETQMRCSLQKGEIKRQDILDVANWGKYSSLSKITAPKIIPITDANDEVSVLQALTSLEQYVGGIEANYITKILRFAFPNRAGALDSRIVRVFGLGDRIVNQYQWLTIRAQKSRSGWSIFRNRMWQMDYQKWLIILSKMVSLVNAKEIPCPHPQDFLDAGLRTERIWVSADVEMAIFSYATNAIR
ncbi:MAG: DNA-directed RNA polymerase subunit alpha C-terminal domain-containing protein [Desulfosporosinus sp.]|nr:DNA-directed RNA polymerase subunit alpha C-terminal domain-containing protein [Desulfosporosinus sp.]